jgi:hypothetical protein
MKLNLLCAFILTCSTFSANAGLSQSPLDKLSIENEIFLTTRDGVALPEQLAKATIGKLVKIYRTDGVCYDGKITEIEESRDFLKVYGETYNAPFVKFGFVLARGGNFAGAVLDNNVDYVYVLEFSEAYKGFVLKKTYRYNKPTS